MWLCWSHPNHTLLLLCLEFPLVVATGLLSQKTNGLLFHVSFQFSRRKIYISVLFPAHKYYVLCVNKNVIKFIVYYVIQGLTTVVGKSDREGVLNNEHNIPANPSWLSFQHSLSSFSFVVLKIRSVSWIRKSNKINVIIIIHDIVLNTKPSTNNHC